MIVRSALVAAALQLAFMTQPLAQQEPACDGTWKYTHIDKFRCWPVDVEVRISGDKGVYFAGLGRHKSGNSPCRNRDLPIVVERCTADELIFRVLGETVFKGCATFTARFKRIGPDDAEATIDRGEVVPAHRSR